MSMSLRTPMTKDEFLAWETRQEPRYEFDGIRPVAMTGGSNEHNIIFSNLLGSLNQRLRGQPCRAYGATMQVEVAGRIRYPDAFVVCSPNQRGAQVFTDPVVIFEIISPSTARTDRVAKNMEYLATPSILTYVMIEQDYKAAIVQTRSGDRWISTVVAGSDRIPLPEIGIELPLDELYDRVEFPDEE